VTELREERPDGRAARSLWVAAAMDIGLCAAKLGAFSVTGSAALLSEGLHSLADVANQGLLALGIRASRRPPDPRHPYGHGRARPFWALLSASGVLFIGAGATLWNGLGRLFDPQPLERLDLALIILGLGVISEAISVSVALRALRLRAQERGTTLREALVRSGDPVLVAIVAQDVAGLVGVVAAAVGVGLSHALGEPLFDAVAALVVGVLMATSALFLIDRNRQILLGSAVTEQQREAVLAALIQSPLVLGVSDIKATSLDEKTVRFKAEVSFDGARVADEWLSERGTEGLRGLDEDQAIRDFLRRFAEHVVHRLGREVDRIEADIQRDHPQVLHIDLEVDAGLPAADPEDVAPGASEE
jgi:zinc transporter 9